MKPGHVLTTILPLVLVGALDAADIRLAAVFSDHMVVQRGKAVPVWGWATPGDHLTVSFAGQEKQATVDGAGRWQVKLDPLCASAESREMIVKSHGGFNKARVADVLVGEVWLGAGQSNMAMTVSRAADFRKVKTSAYLPLIRMFREESAAANRPAADAKGKWSVCSPAAVGDFSAALYFFGRELHRELQVPVGLINSSVGGTPIEAWVAGDVQAKMPELKGLIEARRKTRAALDTPESWKRYQKDLGEWQEQAMLANLTGKPEPARPLEPMAQAALDHGGGLFNGKIAPLIPFALHGVLWYQGEANADPATARFYQYQLRLLVSDWRAHWGGELPFAWVQLPNFKGDGDGWMLVREAMLKNLRLPKTGMAVTIDIGDPNNIHPANKQEVGRRLAMWALGEVYDLAVTATCGPLPAKHETRGNGMVISFTHCHGGLSAKGGELRGFEIAASDRQWRPATARIEGEKIMVSSPLIAKPVAVRYAWAPDPDCNLYNQAGLPASPFRTDDWQSSETKPKRPHWKTDAVGARN